MAFDLKLNYREAAQHGGSKLAHDLGVLHETANQGWNANGAEDIQNYFANTDRDASAHVTFDSNSAAQSVRWEDMAWHAPGANHDGWGFEHWAPYQASAEWWRSKFASDMLEQSADVVAKLFEWKGIPAVWCGEADLLADHRGLTDHSTVSRAFRRSNHYDGIYMPKVKYLAMLNHRLGKGHDPDPIAPWPNLFPGDGMEPDDPKRPWVKKLQVMLDQHPRIRLTPQDGMFGTNTKKAVIQFQQLANIYATGKVGKPTWQALKLTVHAIGLTDEQRAKRS